MVSAIIEGILHPLSPKEKGESRTPQALRDLSTTLTEGVTMPTKRDYSAHLDDFSIA
jgi:hypothetical protein